MKTYKLTRTMHPAGAVPYREELTLEAESEASLFEAYLELKLNDIPGEDGTGKPTDDGWIVENSAYNPGGDCLLATEALTADYMDFTPWAKNELRRYFDEYEKL